MYIFAISWRMRVNMAGNHDNISRARCSADWYFRVIYLTTEQSCIKQLLQTAAFIKKANIYYQNQQQTMFTSAAVSPVSRPSSMRHRAELWCRRTVRHDPAETWSASRPWPEVVGLWRQTGSWWPLGSAERSGSDRCRHWPSQPQASWWTAATSSPVWNNTGGGGGVGNMEV